MAVNPPAGIDPPQKNVDLPSTIDVDQATPVSPQEAPEVSLDPLSSAGVTLAKWVLVLIAGVLVFLFAILAVNEFHTPAFLADAYTKSLSTAQTSDSLLTKILEAKNAAREFWLKMAQLVLLNLLLPVLTAILGYVFGSKQTSKPNG